MFSILIFYRTRIFSIFKNFDVFKYYLKIITVGVFPAVVIGLFTPIQDTIDNSSQILIYTGIAYFFLSILLIFSEKINTKKNRRPEPKTAGKIRLFSCFFKPGEMNNII